MIGIQTGISMKANKAIRVIMRVSLPVWRCEAEGNEGIGEGQAARSESASSRSAWAAVRWPSTDGGCGSQ